jgi:membrane protein DedA with SNARE-associated domain
MAGMTRMTWWRFLFWNAAGGIVWAIAVGLIAYYGGHAAADVIEKYGLYGGIAVVVIVVVGLVTFHILRRRVEEAKT